tara:strand:- start:2128 stop:2799 length:672 start_codon:yes stop_codon:yes gene_type:complete
MGGGGILLSKKLIGYLILVGPLLAIASMFIEPGSLDDSATFADQIQAQADNYAIATISMITWSVGILITFIGIHYLARSMQGEDKPGSDLAGLASIFALLAAGVTMVAIGIDTTIGEKESSWIKEGGDIINATAISAAIARSVFIFNGVIMLFLGLSIVKQKNLSPIIGGLFTFLGACVLFGGIFSSGDNWAGMIWFVGFLGFPLVTVATGILTVRSAGKDVS